MSGANMTIEGLARQAVAAIAPEELPAFDPIARPYLRNPRRMSRALREADDSPLASGIDAAVVLLTPYAVLVATTVFTKVAELSTEDSYVRTRGWLGRSFRRRRKTGELQLPVTALTADQLNQVRSAAMAQGAAIGLSDRRAALLADAIVGALAVNVSTSPPPEQR